jgi:hypothetical protein
MSRNHVEDLLCSILLAGAAGCAATPARIPPEQAARIDAGSGLVFGSIRISVDTSLPDTSPKFAPGRKAAGATHKLVIDCSSALQEVLNLRDVTSFPLTLGEELILVQKLPARRCDLVLEAEGGFLAPMATCLGNIDVRAGEITYFGAVEMALPAVIGVGSQAQSKVADQKAQMVEALRAEYGTRFDDAPFEPCGSCGYTH